MKWLVIIGLTLLAIFSKGILGIVVIGALAYFAYDNIMGKVAGNGAFKKVTNFGL